MSYKKCKNEKYWCECKKRPCKKEPEVIYYECKESKNESKKCDKFVKQTRNLIEKLECKSEKLEEDLETASANQALATQNLNDVKNKLAQIQNDLNDVIDKVNNDIIPRQANAAEAINDAIETQQAIDDIIDCLEDSFKRTVKCLKDNCSDGSCPILIPKKSCHHEWEDECDWEDKCDWKDKCEWEHDCDCEDEDEDEDDCDYEW